MFDLDLRIATATAQQATCASRSKAQSAVWQHSWLPFLASLGIDDPLLETVRDKIPLLKVFALRIRDGRHSRTNRPVRAATVRDQLLSISKTITALGAPDPRHTAAGFIDKRLTDLFKGWEHHDPAPRRVKPVSLPILFQANALATSSPTAEHSAILDMMWIAFFYLLRPGEYAHTTTNAPLACRHVGLTIGLVVLDAFTASPADLLHATSSSLEFDNQKNRVRGEVIAQGRSGHSVACPTRAVARRILYIRTNGGNRDTPLCSFKRGSQWYFVTPALITGTLKLAAATLPHLHIAPADITARSLRAGGAMALLCGRVDTATIQLVGRWRSDAMFRYLHAQALPLAQPLARTMLEHGSYTLAPGAYEPTNIQTLLREHTD